VSTQDRLIYMANQIARNFEGMGGDPVKATADHIASFWDPRMKTAVFVDGAGLSPTAAAAVEELQRRGAPDHQTRATESGGSDAG
jgi:formate dehydrogenase subunit delta